MQVLLLFITLQIKDGILSFYIDLFILKAFITY